MIDVLASKVGVPIHNLEERISIRGTVSLTRDKGQRSPMHAQNLGMAYDALSTMRAVLNISPQALAVEFDARPLVVYAMQDVHVLDESQFERFFQLFASGGLTEADFKEEKR